jgi:hypothetical protein
VTDLLCLILDDGVRLMISRDDGESTASHFRGCMSHDPTERTDTIALRAGGVSFGVTINSQHPAHAMWVKAIADAGLTK